MLDNCSVVIPRDDVDPRYVKSFTLLRGEDAHFAKEFFEDFGFVVFRGIFSDQECEETRNAMWNIIEKTSPGFDRNESQSWSSYKSAGKYGLSMRGPCFEETIVRNRQNEYLIEVFKLLMDETDILVSHDRFTIYRATQVENGQGFTTGPRNVHLDLNPWWYTESSKLVEDGIETLQYEDEQDFIRENNLVVKSMGRHLQCVMNFVDNLEEDGGTIVVPRFHKILEKWCLENVDRKRSLPWIELPLADPLVAYGQRIPMAAGSVLIWDQTLMHGSSPNDSRKCRMAQFIKAFPLRCISEARLLRRSTALVALLAKASVSHDGLSAFGEKCFFGHETTPKPNFT